MRKHILYSLSLIGLLLLSACGQDRSDEYYSLVAAKTWIYDTMQENYLFYQDMPEEGNLNFFKKPAEFLRSVVSGKDQKNGVYFSHIDSVYDSSRTSVSAYPSYGIECAFLRNGNTGKYYARILYVQSNSPASETGLKRGDWILDVDSTDLTTSNYESFIGKPTQDYLYHIARKDDNGQPDTLYIKMPNPRYVADPSVYRTRNFTTESGKKVFYVMYNSFQLGEEENNLKAAFNSGMSESPNDIVLDLRYNPGGYVSTAVLLATMLAPAEAMGKTCLNMIYNDKLNKVESINFDPALLSGTSSFQFDHLYILTTSQTASAAEAVINCLRPYLGERISQVGEYTFGKNVAQSLFKDDAYPQLEFWLTTSFVGNADNYYDYYSSGLKPDYELTEDLSAELGELGTEKDSLMIPVIYHIEHGAFPAQQPADAESILSRGKKRTERLQIISNSIAQKPKRFLWNVLK